MDRLPLIDFTRRSRQRGAALLLFALIGMILGIGLLFSYTQHSDRTSRPTITHDALAQAKAALVGYAATYRDTHAGESFGYLPCPDTDTDGIAEANCGPTALADVTVIGRLPWKTLGLPPLRDADNECLWYAVSGHAKNSPKTADFYNWDTLGQLIVQDVSIPANTLAGATPHDRPFALVFAPGAPLAGQDRTSAGSTECGGNMTTTAYLENVGPLNTGTTTVGLATADSVRNATNNDRAVWISGNDIFSGVRRRTDFKNAVETLLNDITLCLNGISQATLASAILDPAGSKGADNLVAFVTNAGNNCSTYASPTSAKRKFLDNWKNNLLYARLSSTDVTGAATFSAGGQAGCKAVLAFGGERLPAQTRSDAGTQDTHSNYLETMLAAFPGGYTVASGAALGGAATFSSATPAADVAACIRGLPAGAMQASFATNFGNFAAAGTAGAVAPDSSNLDVTLLDASGTTGGCFWYGAAVPLAGKTLRSYYRFTFATGDDPAATPDLRYGFTLQLVKGDEGIPSYCGTEFNSGALGTIATVAAPGTWGSRSFIIENDIFQSASRNDPAANHTAIMKNGSIDHAGYGVLTSTACNGTVNLCEHTPVNKFEELPVPLAHNQRMEITTGCNATCSACNPAAHVSPNTYAQVSVWVDCTECSDVSVALNRATKVPAVQICSSLDVSMNTIYLGFTGGFSSTYPNPVTIGDFVFRSE